MKNFLRILIVLIALGAIAQTVSAHVASGEQKRTDRPRNDDGGVCPAILMFRRDYQRFVAAFVMLLLRRLVFHRWTETHLLFFIRDDP